MNVTRAARDARQKVVADWVRRCFGGPVDPVERATRVLEEAIELAQAVGVDKGRAALLIEVVYDRPAGQPSQEMGGVSLTLLALAEALGLSLDDAERAEIERVLLKTPEHFRERQAEKAKLGVSGSASGPTEAVASCGCRVGPDDITEHEFNNAPCPGRDADRMRDALEFYANPFGRSDEDGEPIQVPDFYSELSFGDRAAKALAPTAPPAAGSTEG